MPLITFTSLDASKPKPAKTTQLATAIAGDSSDRLSMRDTLVMLAPIAGMAAFAGYHVMKLHGAADDAMAKAKGR